MLGLAREAGHEITGDATGADVLVVNTCAFIDSAKKESIDAILEMAAHKRRTGAALGSWSPAAWPNGTATSCQREIPEIDAVLGTGEVEGIVDAIGSAPRSAVRDPQGNVRPLKLFRPSDLQEPGDATAAHRPPRTTDRAARTADKSLPTYLYDAETPRLLTTPSHYAYVKIAEGCDYTCAFCIIPTLRGEYRSRAADSIVREAETLAARGVRELLLISQDTTFYGIDRGERGALAESLLRRLNAIEGLAWIRLLYLYPTTITDDVLEAMAECEKVCRYIDLPLQHASADVLKRMRRPGNRRVYRARLLSRIRHRVPGVTLVSTLIVGFLWRDRAGFRRARRLRC